MHCWMQETCKVYQTGNHDCDFSPNHCVKWIKMDALYKASLLPETARRKASIRVDSDGTDRDTFCRLLEQSADIERFVAEGRNLFLHSRICGNGKTLWAVRFLQSYFDAVWHKVSLDCHALFVNIPSFFLQLKASLGGENNSAQHILTNIEKADLVVFDEVATKSITTFEQEHLLSIISRRLDLRKSCIYTSNLFGSELRSLIGDRLYSRIVSTSTCYEFKGQDKRFLQV